jgi:hypothetical protein
VSLGVLFDFVKKYKDTEKVEIQKLKQKERGVYLEASLHSLIVILLFLTAIP